MQCLDLIASESRRCGELVKNLLSFSRQSPMNVQSTDLNQVVEQCTMLMRHNLEIGSIRTARRLWPTACLVLQCDPSQIEQVLLAVIVNAADAMPKGGNLWLESPSVRRRAPIGHYRARRRLRNSARSFAQDFRAVRDHERKRPRHRSRPGREPRHRRAPQRHDFCSNRKLEKEQP